MTWHLFGNVLTYEGIFANNRGENRGATNTLQKVIRNREQYTTVSAEAIRYALREGWQAQGLPLNRTMPDHKSNVWQDKEFTNWHEYLDDDVLGYMHAMKETKSRRGILEIGRAISVTPWPGTIHQNFATPGSNPAVESENPIPYSIEVHETRYQFPFALTPEWIGRIGTTGKDKNGKKAAHIDKLDQDKKLQRVRNVLEGIQNLRRVGGNHARYMTDYSPEVIVFRWTTDPAPRMLYCFESPEDGRISLKPLLKKLNGGDVLPNEIVIGAGIDVPERKDLEDRKVCVVDGVKIAVAKILSLLEHDLNNAVEGGGK